MEQLYYCDNCDQVVKSKGPACRWLLLISGTIIFAGIVIDFVEPHFAPRKERLTVHWYYEGGELKHFESYDSGDFGVYVVLVFAWFIIRKVRPERTCSECKSHLLVKVKGPGAGNKAQLDGPTLGPPTKNSEGRVHDGKGFFVDGS